MNGLAVREEKMARLGRMIPRTPAHWTGLFLTVSGVARVVWWMWPALTYLADNAIVVATFLGLCVMWFVSKHKERKRTRAYICHQLRESHGGLPEDVLLDRLAKEKVKANAVHQELAMLRKEGVLERVVGIADVVSYRLRGLLERGNGAVNSSSIHGTTKF